MTLTGAVAVRPAARRARPAAASRTRARTAPASAAPVLSTSVTGSVGANARAQAGSSWRQALRSLKSKFERKTKCPSSTLERIRLDAGAVEVEVERAADDAQAARRDAAALERLGAGVRRHPDLVAREQLRQPRARDAVGLEHRARDVGARRRRRASSRAQAGA